MHDQPTHGLAGQHCEQANTQHEHQPDNVHSDKFWTLVCHNFHHYAVIWGQGLHSVHICVAMPSHQHCTAVNTGISAQHVRKLMCLVPKLQKYTPDVYLCSMHDICTCMLMMVLYMQSAVSWICRKHKQLLQLPAHGQLQSRSSHRSCHCARLVWASIAHPIWFGYPSLYAHSTSCAGMIQSTPARFCGM